jgi:hypothetical protein
MDKTVIEGITLEYAVSGIGELAIYQDSWNGVLAKSRRSVSPRLFSLF